MMRFQSAEDTISDTALEGHVVEALWGLVEEHILKVSQLIPIQVILHRHGILIEVILLMLALLSLGLQLRSVLLIPTPLSDTSYDSDHQTKEDRTY